MNNLDCICACFIIMGGFICSIRVQSNLAISNSVNSKSPLFRRKIECPWIYPSPLRFPGYFEAPLFRTFFHFPWDFEIAGFDCIYIAFDRLIFFIVFELKKKSHWVNATGIPLYAANESSLCKCI